MSSSVTNQVNSSMKNPDLNIGVIKPPNKLYKPVLYSETEANKQFRSLNYDIYSNQKKYAFEDTKQTPKLIAWGGAIAAISAAVWLFLAKCKK